MQDHAFIGRQPILDVKQEIMGYELLFRHSALATDAVIEDDLKASARVLVNTLSDMGAQWLLGDKLAFINVDAEMLHSELLELLPPSRTVLEILETVVVNEAVVQRCMDLRKLGFLIALDDHVPSTEQAPMLGCADFIKLDIMQTGLENAAKICARLKSLPLKIIAEKVETRQQFEACKQMGFDYFQGYYFAHPETLTAKVINSSYATVLDLLNLVSNDADSKLIEAGFKRDPALSFKMLRYINSVGFGLSCEIQSIRHALSILGTKQLYRWLTLLMVTAGENTAPPALMKTAITRGRLTELFGEGYFNKSERDNLFIVGVFSMLDAMLEMPMEQVLEKVHLPEPVVDALLNHEGVYGPFLQLAMACESSDRDLIKTLADSLQLDADQVNNNHIAALAWVEGLAL
ncbi:phage resistance protein [mine drainage metagenome]|uniref:Phage resistance protein n=1 Tax=mine drainage metagenome TaxID=410659 RepID=A0A1J5QH22_9ZZZZ